jgi:hypothetical protein
MPAQPANDLLSLGEVLLRRLDPGDRAPELPLKASEQMAQG